MSTHPALVPGNLAVITGAGYGGIGYSIAALLASKPYDMSVLIADNSQASLIQSQNKLTALGISQDKIKIKQTDVTKYSEMEELVKAAYEFGKGKVDVLVLNAGIQTPTADFGNGKEEVDAWNRVLDVNFHGVLHGTQAFTPKIVAQGTPAAIVVTGSKQGITCPPGNPAYNVSKAAVKALTESLAHSLIPTSVTAHLLVPGYTFTKLTSGGASAIDGVKPSAAWTGEQVAQELVKRMEKEFYILCPDNAVTEELDFARIEWNLGDILNRRPALSRWHPDYSAAFAEHLKSKGV